MEDERQTDAQPSETNQLDQWAEADDIGFVQEFWYFLRENKKWWLLPLIASVLLLGLVSFFASTAAAPFIYTVF
ncbi:MAG: DUF5989 family protein [Pirellulaceae bacterium]